MVAPAINPNVTTYASRVPYITPAEYTSAPTAVNVGQLAVGQGVASNLAQLATVILRASGWANSLCYQVLAATKDTQSGRYRMRRDGILRIPLDFTPILEVDSVSWGWAPNALGALTDLTGVYIGEKVIEVPVYNLNNPTPPPVYWRGGASDCYAITQYVNGYAHGLTTAQTAAGVNVIGMSSALGPAVSPLGVYQGTVLNIYDDERSEQVTVLSAAGTTLTLTAVTAFSHAAGVSISALPPDVKQAVISITSALIKSRGSDAVVMQSLRGGGGQTATAAESGGLEDMDIAIDLLKPYARVV
jgi:hypothetical protein